MKNKVDIFKLIQNFDDEAADKKEWIDYHISFMFNEINEIRNTIYIFETVDNEWDRRYEAGEKIGYSEIY